MEIERLNKIISQMSVARMLEIPKCSFCEKPARVDGPTLTGQWAYMCENCLIDKADAILVGVIGTAIIQKEKAEPVDDATIYDVEGEPSTRMDHQVITCPKCKTEKKLEIDAEGPYTCGHCSRKLRVKPLF
jgi:ribosomal protein L37AE/L43A